MGHLLHPNRSRDLLFTFTYEIERADWQGVVELVLGYKLLLEYALFAPLLFFFFAENGVTICT